MNRHKIKTYVAYILIAIMFFSVVPTVYAAQVFTDIEAHWAKSQITDWVGKELIKGYSDGSFKPDNNITRAEFMAMVNRAFGYEKKDIVTFKDVPTGAWYYEEVAKARAAGYISGYEDGTLRPDNPITRAEAAAIIMRIKGLAANPGTAEKFTDASEIPIWSRGAVGAVAAAKIMNGYPDGSFKAGNTITRAEAVVALNRALGSTETMTVTYDKAGVYGPAEGTVTVKGSVIIKAEGVTLQNTIIEGDLIIDKAVGEGDVTLKNLTVKGTAYINGGGANSVHLIDTNLTKAVVLKTNGSVRIVASGKAEVGQLVAQSSVKVEEANLSGKGFTDVVVEKKVEGKLVVTLVGAKVETIEVKNQEVTLSADKNTEVKTLEVKADNVTVATEKGTTITTLVADGKVSVTGQGTIQKAEVNVSGVSFETKPQSQEVATGVTPPTVGTGTTGGSSGGGGGSSTPTVTVNAISNVTLIAGHSTDVAVTTNPTDATVTASSNNTETATVSVSGHTITVTAGETAGNATITVTAAKTGYNNGTRTFTVAVTPDKPASFELGTAKGSLYIDMSSFKDQYGNDIVWDNLVDAYGLDLANSKIYLTTGESVTSDVYATLEQMLDYQVDSIENNIPELEAVLESGGTVIYFDDEDLADIFSGVGLDGMFVGFDPDVHTWVYAEIKGTFNGEAWEISDSCEMPTISTDATLATFEVGGTNVLALGNVDVDNPNTEQGAILSITEPVTGITITTNDAKARAEVYVNDLLNPVPSELLSTKTVSPGDVIVVVVVAESGKTAYYKVTAVLAADKAALTAAINAEYSDGAARTTYVLTEADYTTESWNAYTASITAAIAVEADANATPEDVNAAAAAIGTAKAGLVFAGQADLEAAKVAAAALTETDYTAESWAVLETALAMPEITNAEVVAKTTAINDAIAGLVTVAEAVAADKAALTEEVIKGGNTALDNVTVNLNLVTSIPDGAGCSIIWASSNTGVVATDGTVTRPAAGSGDVTVTLTATITSGSASDTKQFTVTVKAQEIQDSTIEPTTATFDKNTSSADYKDIAVTMTLNGNTLVAIKNGETALTENTDYTVADNVVTIKKEYLAAQADGNVALSIEFDKGDPAILTIIISDTTPVIPNGTLLDADAGSDFTGVLYTRDGNIYYNQADTSGTWGSETLIGTGTEGKMVVDSTGKPHVVYTTSGKIGYKMYDGSDWTEEVLIESNYGGTCSKPDIAVDSSGYAHITYTDTMGNTGDYTDKADIMYATNRSGSFEKTLIFKGYLDYYGGADRYSEGFDKGSLIAIDAEDNYFIMAHKYTYQTWMGGNDRTYSIVVKSNLGDGNTTISSSDIFDIYGLASNGNKVVALYKQTGFKTSELTVSGTTINFTNTKDITGTSVSSVNTDGTNIVVGGTNSTKLQTNYNGIPQTFSDIVVSGNAVSIVHLNGNFYAVYTDNADGKIKMQLIEATYAVNVASVVGGAAEVTVDKTTAAAGETVTVTIANIESGKQFKSITVVDADSQAVTVTEVTAGQEYTFTMPAKAVTVTVEVADTTAPELQAAAVDGATLTLTYDEALDESSVPDAADFTVNVNSSAADVNNVAVSGNTVTLTLADAVNAGDTVTVSYTAGTNPIQDIAGNTAADLTDQSVNNNTADTTAPELQTAVVDGATLTLTYNEALDESSVPDTTDFEVLVNSSAADVNNVAVSGNTVTLTLAAAVSAGDTVTVSYTAGTNPIQDIAGNDAANLTDEAVTNTTA